jgi:CRP/FNR family transcriptional regulator, cyclic AMP receptor protein
VAAVAELAGVPLFASLDDAQLQELAGWFRVQNAGDGRRLVGEGAPGYTFFVILDGTAQVTADGVLLVALGPGDFFGEIAILGDGHRTATVTSTSPVRMLVLFGTEFRQLEAAHPAIAAELVAAMQSRLGQAVTEPA